MFLQLSAQKFWRRFAFLRSTVDGRGEPIIQHPEIFDEFIVRLADIADLEVAACSSGVHGDRTMSSYAERQFFLDHNGRLLRELNSAEFLESRNHRRFRGRENWEAETPIRALDKLPRKTRQNIRFLVRTEQGIFADSREGAYSHASLTVLVVPSAETIEDWLAYYNGLGKLDRIKK